MHANAEAAPFASMQMAQDLRGDGAKLTDYSSGEAPPSRASSVTSEGVLENVTAVWRCPSVAQEVLPPHVDLCLFVNFVVEMVTRR